MVCVCVPYWQCVRRAFWYINRAWRVILGSTHPDRHDVIDFLVERHNYLPNQAWKTQKTRHVTLEDSIPTAKNDRKHLYFVFKLGEPALLESKTIAYEYACISWYPWHMKNVIKKFYEEYPGSIIILKMVNDPLRVWKENHSIKMFRYYFRINKGYDHILLGDDKKVTEVKWNDTLGYVSLAWNWVKDILRYPKRSSALLSLFKIFHVILKRCHTASPF